MTPTQFVDSAGVQLAVYTWGTPGTRRQPKPVLVLVHGYPDSAEVWTAVAEQLASTCFVVAYDVRGAGLSQAPTEVQAYTLPHLSADLAAVVNTLSPDTPVHLVGHDWGALQGWEALHHPQLQGRIASYSTAAPSLDQVGVWFQRRAEHGQWRAFLTQALGSSYMLAFQMPILPELSWRLLLGRHWSTLLSHVEGVQAKPSHTQTSDGLHGLQLYRANLLPKLLQPQPQSTDIPIQLLVMTRDRFVPQHLFAEVSDWASRVTRTEIAAGHWAPLSHPHAVADAIRTFVTTLEH